MSRNDSYLYSFFDWVGNAGCIFPFKGKREEGKLQLVDIETMKSALDFLFYDEKSKIYATRVNEFAEKNELIYDPMEIIPFEQDKLVLYEWLDDDELVPEPLRFMTLDEFSSKYPNAINLLEVQ